MSALYKKELLSHKEFILKLLKYLAYSFFILFISLSIGVWGYSTFGNLSLVDAFLNASMILTGMGPVNSMKTFEAKIFSSFYALYSGIAFLSTVVILLSPVVHRFLHKFHLDLDD